MRHLVRWTRGTTVILALGLQPSATAAGVFYAVSTLVEDLARERVHPVFLLDEAHLLHQDTLDHLHILLNYAWDSRALLSLILVGITAASARSSLTDGLRSVGVGVDAARVGVRYERQHRMLRPLYLQPRREHADGGRRSRADHSAAAADDGLRRRARGAQRLRLRAPGLTQQRVCAPATS